MRTLDRAKIHYRRIENTDYTAVLALLNSAYIDDLSAEAKRQGFIAARFDRQKLEEMNESLALLVATDGTRILGVLGLTRTDTTASSPIIAAMQKDLPHQAFSGHLLTDLQPFFFGPVCIASEARGCGIFRGLYQAMWEFLDPAHYNFGVAFIAKENTHSLAVHNQGLQLPILGDFSVSETGFYLIGYPRPPALSTPAASRI